jgi:hypothetical protein
LSAWTPPNRFEIRSRRRTLGRLAPTGCRSSMVANLDQVTEDNAAMR